MGYAITVIIHEDGYTPAGPSTEDVDLRRSVKLYDTSSLRRTEIHYDDSEAVPAGTAQELDRWNMPVSMADQNRWTIERQAEDIAMPRLTEIRGECNTIIADQNITNAEAVAYIQALAAHNNDVALYLRKLIRLVVRLLDAAD